MTLAAVAHRGAPCTARENTLAAFAAAVLAGADVVELDVRCTADGVPVVLHDATLERLWGYAAEVAAVSSDEVRRRTGGGVPRLGEALDATRSVRTLVDLPEPAAAARAVAEVRAAGAERRVYYCGGPDALRAVREADPDAELALTWQRTAPVHAALVERLRPRWLNYRFGLVTPQVIERAHGAGLLVSAWTVDRSRTMRRLASMGVDALTTNRVERLVRLLHG
ncbi:glycerophosphodiester phosphodiesterase [Streptomyces xiaopingdaonensis]|uniref:glycerophosphodiester phosphodiesterase n=1 Tax=Streptomyces xiaopingdaonensis TaxID=1565415 RepID=UPI000313FFB6|nr:glycerophosphodiester phosphodiesterase [Streptomyces xiaopingdaonensis]